MFIFQSFTVSYNPCSYPFGEVFPKERTGFAMGVLSTMVSFGIALGPSLGSLSANLPLLIAGRAGQGLGGAILMALSFAFVGEVFPKERTGFAMGVLSTMVSFGIALGPSLGSLCRRPPPLRGASATGRHR
ncbi:MFS transporter [Mycobacterium tuberculosis]|uniref:MFS transporter n=1 Tax=Mycobacterium tuberculosis TaxID=1773 RepID=UPI0027298293|nr:MFS transporter [Mycobacterium tuberculosis]